jgi:hypothetical protein
VAPGLTLVTFALALLTVIAEACAPPSVDVSPDSPAAQATNVRRTAVAEVQRIIANNPTATPLPAASATPAPTCQNAIWWTDARSHVGEARTIQGTVVSTRPAAGGAVLLEIGQPYPDPIGLAVLLPATTAASLIGKTVCVAGRIIFAEGRTTLQVGDPSTIKVID